MVQASLAEFTSAGAAADEPAFVAAVETKLGGVDPLGLRQINFDLMDQVLPNLNNVGRHIRPFVVVTWAWRRARWLAQARRVDEVPIDDLRDFVDRIEVLYAWSQFLLDPDSDLPGRQVLAPLLRSDRWVFGGSAWRKRREGRQYSTAFTAPITYGPALKFLGWVSPHRDHADVLIPTDAANEALNSFEAQIIDRLNHPAFNQLGKVEVTREEAMDWSRGWALDQITKAEQRAMTEMLFGTAAPPTRRRAGELILAAAAHAGTADEASVRWTMAGAPSDFVPPPGLDTTFEAWRRIQVRQLFRLSLEALFHWVLLEVENGPKSIDALVSAFLDQLHQPQELTAREWLDAVKVVGQGPTDAMASIQQVLADPTHAELASTIVAGLAFSIAEAPEYGHLFERADRLPLFRARREAIAWSPYPVANFVRHIIESWVLAQHVYWSVGRGLADARAQGKRILRLKVVLEEGGWTMAPGASRGAPPIPTPDRLRTALTLAAECGLLDSVAK